MAEACVCVLLKRRRFRWVAAFRTASAWAGAWQPGMSFTELYRHADQALYAAKKAGRNQVMQAAQPA
jgi:PleD family two-component response regulator